MRTYRIEGPCGGSRKGHLGGIRRRLRGRFLGPLRHECVFLQHAPLKVGSHLADGLCWVIVDTHAKVRRPSALRDGDGHAGLVGNEEVGVAGDGRTYVHKDDAASHLLVDHKVMDGRLYVRIFLLQHLRDPRLLA